MISNSTNHHHSHSNNHNADEEHTEEERQDRFQKTCDELETLLKRLTKPLLQVDNTYDPELQKYVNKYFNQKLPPSNANHI
jgi:hypothetical protein